MTTTQRAVMMTVTTRVVTATTATHRNTLAKTRSRNFRSGRDDVIDATLLTAEEEEATSEGAWQQWMESSKGAPRHEIRPLSLSLSRPLSSPLPRQKRTELS